jgi:hypothetical protein
MKNKPFDCVQMKQHCQDEVRKHLGTMTDKQEINFFQKAGVNLQDRIRAAKKNSHTKA